MQTSDRNDGRIQTRARDVHTRQPRAYMDTTQRSCGRSCKAQIGMMGQRALQTIKPQLKKLTMKAGPSPDPNSRNSRWTARTYVKTALADRGQCNLGGAKTKTKRKKKE